MMWQLSGIEAQFLHARCGQAIKIHMPSATLQHYLRMAIGASISLSQPDLFHIRTCSTLKPCRETQRCSLNLTRT